MSVVRDQANGKDKDSRAITRRALVAGAGSILIAGAVQGGSARAEDAPATDKASQPNAIPPADALERLKAGNARYVAGESENGDLSVARVAQIETGYPIAGVLSCSESPVPPEIVFDQTPGQLFVSSNAANFVSEFELASLEFALTSFGIPLIFVLGYSNTSAILTALSATIQRKQLPGNLPALVKAIEPAVIAAHGKHSSDPVATTIKENVRYGIKRLKTQSKIIGDAALSGKLKIAGGVYDLKTGKVELL